MSRKRRGRGEGGIRHREDKDLWEATVRDGNGRRRSVYAKTKAEVQQKLRELQGKMLRGLQADAGTLTLGEYLTRWLETAARRSVRTSTHVRYEQLVRLRIRAHLGNVRLGKLSPLHVEQFLTDLANAGVSARGQQMAVNVLGRALKDAIRLRLIDTNPVRDVTKPKPAKPEIQYWNPVQVKAFLDAGQEDRLQALYVLAIATGMRSGELFALEWSDLDLEARTVVVQRSLNEVAGQLAVKEVKTAKGQRRIDLPQFAVSALRDHRARLAKEGCLGKLVFCDEKGGYLRRPNVTRRSFRPLMKAAGVPQIRFHDLRHTAATLLLMADVNPKIVQERLGHATVQITLDTYSHVLPTLQKVATERLERLFSQIGGTMAVPADKEGLAKAS